MKPTTLGIIDGAMARSSRQPAPGSTPVLVVASGTRGVGTSSAAAALAVEFADSGRQTLLVDNGEGSVLTASVAPAGAPYSLASLSAGVEPEQCLIPAGLDLWVVVGDNGTVQPASASERRFNSTRAMELFARFDVVVVDAGSRAAGVLNACAYNPAALIAVSSADAIVCASTYALLKLINSKHSRLSVWVLENRESDGDGFVAWGLLAEGARRFLGCSPMFAGTLPDTPVMQDRLAQYATADTTYRPVDPASSIVADVARQLLASFEPPTSPHPFSSSIPGFRHGHRTALANAGA